MSERMGIARRGPILRLLVAVTIFAACTSPGQSQLDDEAHGLDVAEVAGWTRAATSPHYLIVVNVLPGEPMYTHEQIDDQHPTEGELIVEGVGAPIGAHVRHVEAHIYSRSTGLPETNMIPELTVTNLTTGESFEVSPTQMEDIAIGASDRHFGNNVVIVGGCDLLIKVTVGREEVTVDGHLD